MPKVNGVIWVHDYEGEHDGVRRAVDALVTEGRMRETERRGLSWVGVRVGHPEEVALVAALYHSFIHTLVEISRPIHPQRYHQSGR